ncbi:MAG: filamentous hemagglutinin N-terminal domain-containing protein [Cyanobacteria bacterium P01_F01_bin.143]
MIKSNYRTDWGEWNLKQRLSLSLLLSLSYCGFSQGIFLNTATAQVAPDNTTNTTVDVNGSDFTINQGDRADNNLFHSFSDFSVPTDGSAFFNNSADIVNIFSRVTGGNISNIDGLLRANGTANLYLINPAGIIFGEGARLDIGGSFFGSTADSINFPDGEFSATDLANPPLITINAPIGLSFRDNPGDITNRSDLRETNVISQGTDSERTIVDQIGLQVNPGNNITLVGGNIFLEDSGITAPGGVVNLGGLSTAGEISFNPDGSLSFPDGATRADVSLSNDASVDVRAGGGGFINVDARNLTLTDQSELFAGIAENMGSPTAQAGDININAIESVQIIGQESQTSFGSFSAAEVEGVFVEKDLTTAIRNNVGVSSARRISESDRSSAIGNAGNININTGTLDLINVSSINNSTYGVGNGGNITIQAQSISLTGFNTLIEAKVRGLSANSIQEVAQGNGGDINILTGSLSLDNSEINTSVLSNSEGNAGNININASGEVFLFNNSQFAAQVIRRAEGNSGNININAANLSTRGSRIMSDNQGGGNAGNITINATDSVVLNSIDQTLGGRISLIIAQLQSSVVGEGGDITISAPQISLNNFALISTNIAVNVEGEAGNITLNADTISIDNGSVIDALTETDFDGGDININANLLQLSNGGKIVTGADRGGNAGDITLNIAGDIIFNNANPAADSPFNERNLQGVELQTGIFANNFPNSTGNGGIVTISADLIVFEEQSIISAETVSGVGGDIFIDADFIVATPNQNNDIISNAVSGDGGRININAEALFGIEERLLNDTTNDINASSDFGLDGTISIFTPDTNTLQTEINLPNNLIESEKTVAQVCQSDRASGIASGLTIKGKGGVPSTPTNTFDSEVILVDEAITTRDIKPIKTNIGDIYPARGIIKTEDGKIILTAYATDNLNSRTPHISANCNIN